MDARSDPGLHRVRLVREASGAEELSEIWTFNGVRNGRKIRVDSLGACAAMLRSAKSGKPSSQP